MVIECCTKNDSINNRICDRISPSIVNSFLNIILCVELVLGVLYRTDLSVWGSRYILWGLFGGYCLVALYRIFSRLDLYSKSFWAITIMLIVIGIVDYFSTGRNMFLKMTVILLAIGGGVRRRALFSNNKMDNDYISVCDSCDHFRVTHRRIWHAVSYGY